MLFVGLPGKNIGKKPEKGKSMQSPHPRTGKLQYFGFSVLGIVMLSKHIFVGYIQYLQYV